MQIPLLCACVLYSMGSREFYDHIWALWRHQSHMGEMRDSDWSRENLLRSDWLLPTVAMITTKVNHGKKEIVLTFESVDQINISTLWLIIFNKTPNKTFENLLSASFTWYHVLFWLSRTRDIQCESLFRMRQTVIWCRCILAKLHLCHSSSKTPSYVPRLDWCAKTYTKNHKKNTLKKWPKKSVETYSPANTVTRNVGQKAQVKT